MEPTCLTGFQERWNQTSESHREAETEGQRVNSVDRNSRPSADKTNIAMENPNHKWRFSSLGKSSISMGHLYHGTLLNNQRVRHDDSSMSDDV